MNGPVDRQHASHSPISQSRPAAPEFGQGNVTAAQAIGAVDGDEIGGIDKEHRQSICTARMDTYTGF